MNEFNPSELLYENTVHGLEHHGTYVNAKLLDEISGYTITEKFRKLKLVVGSIVEGSSIREEDVLRSITIPGSKTTATVVAVGIMHLIVVRGFKQLPWNQRRRMYVQYFFPDSPHLVPDFDPYHTRTHTNPSQHDTSESCIIPIRPAYTTTVPTEQEDPLDAQEFWSKIESVVIKNNLSIKPFAEKLLSIQIKRQKRGSKRRQDVNHIAELTDVLFNISKCKENFQNDIFLSVKTGNWRDILHVIKKYLTVPGLGQSQIVPSVNAIKSMSRPIISKFIALFKPEKTYSGFRIDLVSAVKIVCYLLMNGRTNLQGLHVDIWGDGVEIGKKDQTRMAFRFLRETNISAQSSEAVFTFAVFQGKIECVLISFSFILITESDYCFFLGHDSRYVLETNIGYEKIGCQESAWLYKKTKELHDLGIHLTYSGDQPFLLKLILGITKDDSENSGSKMPMYVGNDNSVKPETIDVKTGRRMDVRIPFRTDQLAKSLVFLPDIRVVCPDATHALTRCVEGDLRKLAEKLMGQDGVDAAARNALINRFESNLSERDVKPPRFAFSFNKGSDGKMKCGPISLSGREAITAIADMDELKDATQVTSELFEGVFTQNKLLGSGENSDCISVLRELHPDLFNQPHVSNPDGPRNNITLLNACELWRRSLNRMSILLRGSKDGFSGDTMTDYIFWGETYYQVSRALFDTKLGITPYKVKLLLIPQLVESGFIRTPWDHMTEGLEKSNHHSHKNFQTRSMRGGGQHYNPDPMFHELFLSFCSLLKISRCTEILNKHSVCYEALCSSNIDIDQSFLNVCEKTVQPACLPIGEKLPMSQLFQGLRFYVHGHYSGICHKNGSKMTNESLKLLIKQLGGIVMEKSALDVILSRHSDPLYCYVVLRDGNELKQATTFVEAEDTELNPSAKPGEKRKLMQANQPKSTGLVLRQFVRGGLKFVSAQFVLQTANCSMLLDPASFELTPGNKVNRVRVRDARPLLLQQCDPALKKYVSAIVSVKNARKCVKPNTQSPSDSENDSSDSNDELDL